MTSVIPPTIDVHLSGKALRGAMERDVRHGLTAKPKQLPPVYFYDDRGSRLFDEITRLPEYYPTRSERSILAAHAGEIARRSEADTLVELGAGTCEKSRVLLDAMQSAGHLHRFVPLDVSDTTLWDAATALSEEYPGVAVSAVVAISTSTSTGCPPTADGCSPSSAAPSATSIPANAGTSSSSSVR
jgi:L-histidine N-alpha-methyltransferase